MTDTVRVLITGSREFTDRPTMAAAINLVRREHAGAALTIVHGAARGADSIASAICRDNPGKLIEEPHPVTDWQRPDGSRDRAAGHRRNQRMVMRVPSCASRSSTYAARTGAPAPACRMRRSRGSKCGSTGGAMPEQGRPARGESPWARVEADRVTLLSSPFLVDQPAPASIVLDRFGDAWERGRTRWTCITPVDGARIVSVARMPWSALAGRYGPVRLIRQGAYAWVYDTIRPPSRPRRYAAELWASGSSSQSAVAVGDGGADVER